MTTIQLEQTLGAGEAITKTCIQGVPAGTRYDATAGVSEYNFTLNYNAKDIDPTVYYSVIAYFSQGNISNTGQSPVFSTIGNQVSISVLHPNTLTD